MNDCHTSEILDDLAKRNCKVRVTLFDGRIYEGWIDTPLFGYGYILENPIRYDYTLKFYKSHVKKIEVIEETL